MIIDDLVWHVAQYDRNLGRNGSLVRGAGLRKIKLSGDKTVALRDGDEIALGPNGVTVTFHLL